MDRMKIHRYLTELDEKEKRFQKEYLMGKKESNFGVWKTYPEHMDNKLFRIDERNNMELVRHDRYTFSPMHDHTFFELAFVYQGKCEHTFLLGEKRVTSHLETCDLLLIPPGLKHEIGIFDDSVMVNILINWDTFQQVFFTKFPDNNLLFTYFQEVLFSPDKQSFLVFRTEGDEKLKEILLDMIAERLEPDLYTNLICEHLLDIFFLQVLRHPQRELANRNVPAKGRALAASMVLYIENHYAHITMAELAAVFHFSETYLGRIFKEHTDMTVLQYARECRLTEANRLIRKTELPVEIVATTVGYEDTSYFISQYREKYGITPLQDRRKNRP